MHISIALVVLEHLVINDDHLIGAQGPALLGQTLHAGAQQDARRRPAQALGCTQ
jgi:hypothetical protein